MNLKPCPFCGTDPMWLTKVTFECNNHECVIGGHKIRDAEAWNKRALPPEGLEPPPGYRTGRRKLMYNKLTKQIDVVDAASGFVVDSFDPPLEHESSPQEGSTSK